MPVRREVKSKVLLPKKSIEPEAEEVKVPMVVSEVNGKELTEVEQPPKKKVRCQFCDNQSEPEYWNSTTLRRFISDRGRIQARSRTYLCAKHQRRLTKQIKYARHLSLLPFLVRA